MKIIDRAISILRTKQQKNSLGSERDYDSFLEVYVDSAPNLQQTLDIFKGAWSARFPKGYNVVAGETPLFEDDRVDWLIANLGGVSGLHILELGPLEGAHSYMLENAGAASITAVESSTIAYLKCLITKETVGLERVKFEYGDFMEYLAGTDEKFDMILASGVLYHQSDPLNCLKLIAERTDCVFIWTHCYDESIDSQYIKANYFSNSGVHSCDDFSCYLYRLAYDKYLPSLKYRGGLKDHTHWMRKKDILSALRYFGFNNIQLAFEVTEHPFGPNLAILAQRSDPAICSN